MLDQRNTEHGEVSPPPRLCTSRSVAALRPRALCVRGWQLVAPILLLLLSLSACGAASGGLERVQAAGVLRVAIDPSFPPFESVNTAGEVEGLDVELARAVAAELGVEAQFVTTGYDALYDALTAGRADVIMSALYPDPSRTHAFIFSEPYFDAGHVLVVPAESEITQLDDLSGRRLACVFGTTGHMAVLEHARTMAQPPEVLTVDHPITITQLLNTARVDAIVTDHASALIATSDHEGELRILDPPVESEPYVIAVRKEDGSLAKAIDTALVALRSDSKLAHLVAKWMKP